MLYPLSYEGGGLWEALVKVHRVDLRPRCTSPLVSGGLLVAAPESRAYTSRDLAADVNSVADRGGVVVRSVGRCCREGVTCGGGDADSVRVGAGVSPGRFG